MRRRSSKKKRSSSACAPREPSPLPRDRAAPARCDLCMEVCSDLLQYLPVVHVYGSLKSPPGGLQRKYFTVVRTVPSSAHRMRHRLATHNRRFMASRQACIRASGGCVLYEQKGGNGTKEMQKDAKSTQKKRRKSKKKARIPQIYHEKGNFLWSTGQTDTRQTDRRDGRKPFSPQSWGTSFLRPTRILLSRYNAAKFSSLGTNTDIRGPVRCPERGPAKSDDRDRPRPPDRGCMRADGNSLLDVTARAADNGTPFNESAPARPVLQPCIRA